jgi:hypothetical protein
MSIKINLSAYPSITLPTGYSDYTINWTQADIFSINATSNLNLYFSNDTSGKEIILSITNTSSNTITLNWPIKVVGAENTISTQTTKSFKLSKFDNSGTIIVTTELSTVLRPELLSKTFTTSGTFTIPQNVTTFYITCYGACGGGGGSGAVNSYGMVGGGGGGGGYGQNVVRTLINTTPGLVYNVNIGSGGGGGGAGTGNGGNGGNGQAGGTTTITNNSTTIVTVLGGSGGGGGTGGFGDAYTVIPGGSGGSLGGTAGHNGFPTNASGYIDYTSYGGAGGVNPLDSSIKGGDGGYVTAHNGQTPGHAGNSGSSAKVIIEFS